MLEIVERPRKIGKKEFEDAVAPLRVELVNAQTELRERDFSVVLVIAGDDWPACVEALQSMHQWMDGREIEPHPLDLPSSEERERPWLWRYWRRLPAHGRIGVFLEGWTVELIRGHVAGEIDELEFERRLDHVESFERGLVEDGTLLLKTWFHLGRKQLGKRLEKAAKDPKSYWWADEERSRRLYERYDEALPVAERVLDKTSCGASPWRVIASEHDRHRNLAFATAIRDAVCRRLTSAQAEGRGLLRRPGRSSSVTPPLPLPSGGASGILADVDLTLALRKSEYTKRRRDLQRSLRRVSDAARERGVSSMLVLEGWDAAGKGGIIRRLTRALDPRLFKLVPVAAPSFEEAARHHLWRFWSKVPPAGKMTFFDRSWYGRVLVERVEGLASEAEWRRAYGEIRDFEEQIAEFGIVVLKFWIHIDPEEQRRRFEARERTPYKKYKITPEDYRNRDHWTAYEAAVDEMVRRTSTSDAPWHLVAGNDKRWARIDVMEKTVAALEERLEK